MRDVRTVSTLSTLSGHGVLTQSVLKNVFIKEMRMKNQETKKRNKRVTRMRAYSTPTEEGEVHRVKILHCQDWDGINIIKEPQMLSLTWDEVAELVPILNQHV